MSGGAASIAVAVVLSPSLEDSHSNLPDEVPIIQYRTVTLVSPLFRP